MANPNPSPATRFSADNPGRARQKGARDRLTADFLDALAASFEKHGKAAIERVCNEDPAAYIRVVASLLPKEIQLPGDALSNVPDDKLAELIGVLTDIVNSGKPSPEPEPAPEPKERVVN